jgi:hypothetical protein
MTWRAVCGRRYSEDIGAAAGLANPEGGWAPRNLAQLADAITTKLNDAAAAAAAATAAAAAAQRRRRGNFDDVYDDAVVGAGAAGAEEEEQEEVEEEKEVQEEVEEEEEEEEEEEVEDSWWDPEALARLLCALSSHRGPDAAPRATFMPARDQATLAHTLVTDLNW